MMHNCPIYDRVAGEENPERVTYTYELKQTLRYGENPHQQASFYIKPLGSRFSIAHADQTHGKELSYNNIRDTDAALQIVKEFEKPAAVAVKHMNPCGVGMVKMHQAHLQKHMKLIRHLYSVGLSPLTEKWMQRRPNNYMRFF